VAETEAIAAILRITSGNFRLLHRLFAKIERVVQINALDMVTKEGIEIARQQLVIGSTSGEKVTINLMKTRPLILMVYSGFEKVEWMSTRNGRYIYSSTISMFRSYLVVVDIESRTGSTWIFEHEHESSNSRAYLSPDIYFCNIELVNLLLPVLLTSA
jgi:hypothetical protein